MHSFYLQFDILILFFLCGLGLKFHVAEGSFSSSVTFSSGHWYVNLQTLFISFSKNQTSLTDMYMYLYIYVRV